MPDPRPSTKRVPNPYVEGGMHYFAGVIREGNRIVWQCEHAHPWQSSSYGIRETETSGMQCARIEIERRSRLQPT